MRRPFKDFRPLKKYRKFTLIDTDENVSEAAVDTQPQQEGIQPQGELSIRPQQRVRPENAIIPEVPEGERLEKDTLTLK